MSAKETVVVLGASPKPERYSNQAVRALVEHGHRVIPVHPLLKEIAGVPVVPALSGVKDPVNTLTLYVGPERGKELLDDMINLGPDRVVMNPGTESDEIEEALNAKGIAVLRACTLVMLRTDQF
ncbi:MAG: CoA-binding protein [Deltaproteobacteria bacterium]|jgi:predicted CoA-binding protein|nr:CoA-binding protein [Deltaproteobacteria bacterium]